MTSRRARRPASPLRAALVAKTSLHTFHDIAVKESLEVDAAQRQLEAARQLHTATMLSQDGAVKERAKKALDEAQAARDECFYRIWFRGLGFNEFDALVDLHPPTDEQRAEGRQWDPDTFEFALLAACAGDLVKESKDTPDVWVPADLTAEEWQAELDDEARWTRSDRNRVVLMALAAQRQTMADAVPKD